jgi:hypothetical protein
VSLTRDEAQVDRARDREQSNQRTHRDLCRNYTFTRKRDPNASQREESGHRRDSEKGGDSETSPGPYAQTKWGGEQCEYHNHQGFHRAQIKHRGHAARVFAGPPSAFDVVDQFARRKTVEVGVDEGHVARVRDVEGDGVELLRTDDRFGIVGLIVSHRGLGEAPAMVGQDVDLSPVNAAGETPR